jgi:hypothetical protein
MLRLFINLTASLGIEPRMPESKSGVLPITPQGNIIYVRSRSFDVDRVSVPFRQSHGTGGTRTHNRSLIKRLL